MKNVLFLTGGQQVDWSRSMSREKSPAAKNLMTVACWVYIRYTTWRTSSSPQCLSRDTDRGTLGGLRPIHITHVNARWRASRNAEIKTGLISAALSTHHDALWRTLTCGMWMGLYLLVPVVTQCYMVYVNCDRYVLVWNWRILTTRAK